MYFLLTMGLWLLSPCTLLAQEAVKKEKAQPDAPAPQKKSTWEKVKETGREAGEKVLEYSERAVESVGRTLNSARDNRAASRWSIQAHYSYFDMLVPGKWGLNVGYIPNPDDAVELEYTRGSFSLGWLGLDIGEVVDQRVTLQWRRWAGRGTFNTQWGIHYNRFDVHLGNGMLKSVAAGQGDYSVMRLETLGPTWGIGNRWQTKGGFTWACDWIQIHVPLVLIRQETPYVDATTDEDDKHLALKTLNVIRNFPRLAALKFQIGYSF